MAKAELTVILPNMASLVQQEINQHIFPEIFNKVLKKASFTADETSLERRLINHFTTAPQTSSDLPIANLRSEQKNVLCADPCYLHADRDRLLLLSDSLEITKEEANELISAIQPLLTEFGANLENYNSEQWFISLKAMPDLDFTALAEVNGKAVHNYLPIGDEQTRLAWLRLWNEIQMHLFDLPLNEQRQQQGKLPINSLWFWGKGELNVQPQAWQTTVGSNVLLQQLAKQANVDHKAVIEQTDMRFTSGKHLIVFEPLDLEGYWQQQLAAIDQIVAIMWQQLKWNKVAKVNLEIPNYGCYQLTPFNCWKPWT